jgi:flagellar motility protein MotE (MotC chaperone)
VSASEIIKELPKLSEADRRTVLEKLRELAVQDEDVRACEQAADYRAVDLRSRGITEVQASDLRARLKTFAEDWDRPEAAVYDEDPAR